MTSLSVGSMNCDGGRGPFSADHSEDFVLAHDHVLHFVDLDLGAGILAHQHAIADLHLERNPVAVLIETAGPHPNHLALEGLLLGRVRYDDPTLDLLLGLDP